MSQTFFRKLDLTEKTNRLSQLSSTNGQLVGWVKGGKEKVVLTASSFDSKKLELKINDKTLPFAHGSDILCSFEFRGISYFAQVTISKQGPEFSTLIFAGDLFKSERRNTFRLLTHLIYDVWGEFDLGEKYEGSNIVDFNARTSQTKIFQNFLKLADGKESESDEDLTKIKIRIQDISVTGMAIHVSDLELKYFEKDKVFKNVNILFADEVISVPEVKIVYVVEFLAQDKKSRRFKVGCHFSNLPSKIDDTLGKKINSLLRENDFNKDFENFIK
jgi:hypothetical protein